MSLANDPKLQLAWKTLSDLRNSFQTNNRMSHLGIHDLRDALLAATAGALRTSSEIARSLESLVFFPIANIG